MSESNTPPDATDPAVGEQEALRRQIDDLTAKLRVVSKAFQDQQSESKAFRERFEAAAKLRAERQALDLVRAFFDPGMNLKRSLAGGWNDAEGLVSGIKLVHQQFEETLVRLGLEPVPGVGAPFDPAVHEAVTAVDVVDPAQDGRVLELLSDGFHVRGQVLQTAKVVVGRHVAPAGEA